MDARRLLSIALALCISVQAGAALAQAYPSRPITLVVPFAAGGPVDAMARLVGSKMSESIGQPVVIENRAGASGVFGMSSVAHSQADGHTVLYTPISIAIVPALYRKLPFDAEKDLVPVAQVVSTTLVLAVHPKTPAKNLEELVALAKARPGKLNFGSSGVADPLQLGIELLKTMSGTEMLAIPYKGQGPMFQALLGGEVDLAIVSLQGALSQMKSGKLRILAVAGAKRSTALPDVPTIDESGLRGFDISSWHGVFAPAATPRDAIDRLQREVNRAVHLPDVRKRVESTGNEVVGNTPEEFGAKFRADVTRFKTIVKNARIPYQD